METATLVRSRQVTATAVLEAHLGRIDELEPAVNAFAVVRRAAARQDARALDARTDLTELPLAGVPVGVKDDVDVAGLATRKGSLATSPRAAEADDTLVARLRDAGAVVVGKTNVPELMAWPFTETVAFGATRNPWDLARTPGGSSGGSAAAVAAGMVPLAVGSDGLGSIRIPGACCGLVGIKPGTGVVPRPRGAGHAWFGMSEHGPLATSVADVILALRVMAGADSGRDAETPRERLRIAASVRSPFPGVRVRRSARDAVDAVTEVLARAGHAVAEADPPYPSDLTVTITARWSAGVATDASGLDRRLLERRTRQKLRVGRLAQRVRPPEEARADAARAAMDTWFLDHDVLITPVLARPQLRVGSLARRGWLATSLVSMHFAPFPEPWNLVGYPGAVVPVGLSRSGLPVGVQLVAPRGREPLLLEVASQLERRRPWPRLPSPPGG